MPPFTPSSVPPPPRRPWASGGPLTLPALDSHGFTWQRSCDAFEAIVSKAARVSSRLPAVVAGLRAVAPALETSCVAPSRAKDVSLQRAAAQLGEARSAFISKKMDSTFDIQRDHVNLLELTAKHLKPGGTLIFSNNRRGFKLEADALPDLVFEEITHKTKPDDFARNNHVHRAWRITHQS